VFCFDFDFGFDFDFWFAFSEKARMHKAMQAVLLIVETADARLHTAHIQLLAAILRQESLQACGHLSVMKEKTDVRLADIPDSETVVKGWGDFEMLAGRAVVCLLRHLVSSVRKGDNQDQDLQQLVVKLCHSLLELVSRD
jgi:hypothetical protein